MSKKSVSDVVSGGGLFLSIMTDFERELKRRGVTNEGIHKLGTPQGRPALTKMAQIGASLLEGDEFPVTIYDALPVQDMIAAGEYDEVNADFIRDFPQPMVTGVRRESIKLARFLESPRRFIGGNDVVLQKFPRFRLRPATLPELLAFGAAYPDAQLEDNVIGLGSAAKKAEGDFGDRYPVLSSRDGKNRTLATCWPDDEGWRRTDVFAGVVIPMSDTERQTQHVSLTVHVLPLTINRSFRREEVVQRSHYARANSGIFQQDFPEQLERRTIETSVHLAVASAPLNRRQAQHVLEREYLRPANLDELLAFGLQYRGGHGLTIALGSAMGSPLHDNLVPAILGEGGEREVALLWDTKPFQEGTTFLAFPEERSLLGPGKQSSS